MRKRLNIMLAVLLGMAFVLSGPRAAVADTASPPIGHVVEPSVVVDGMSGGDVMGETWSLLFTLPKKQNPSFGNDRCRTMGQDGEILSVPGEGPVTCTVKKGTTVFAIGIMGFCGTFDKEASFTPEEQRACATRRAGEDVKSISLTIDGGAPIDLMQERFFTCSPQREVDVVKPNGFGINPGDATFSACGWVAWIKNLPVGTHQLRSLTTFVDGGFHPWEPDVVVQPAH
jgi:hypothetical protein